MQSINVLIVDDEQPARGTLRLLLQRITDVEIVGECSDGKGCLQFISTHKGINLVFLDIEMPGMDGLQVASAIKCIAPDVYVVFSTGYSQFAVEAFELEALDYILKPYRKDRVVQTIDRLRLLMELMWEKSATNVEIGLRNQKLIVRMEEKIKLLDPATEIVFVSNEKAGGTRFFTTSGIIEAKISLKDFEEQLLSKHFLRTHRCYFVNIDFIKDIIPWFNDTYMLTLKGYEGYQVPVSRTFLRTFKLALGIL